LRDWPRRRHRLLIEPITVLHVDDEPPLLDLTKTFLERQGGIEVRSESDPERALERLDGSIDCVLSGYQMPAMDGVEPSDDASDGSVGANDRDAADRNSKTADGA